MATLARRLFKVALFVGLFCLAVPFVHTYPEPWTESQTTAWLHAANRLGIRDPDDLYIPLVLLGDLLVAVVLYVAIMKVWRWYQGRKSTWRDSG
ncbi:hypothetical protein EVC45_05410 [Paraburkholderia sp. UYCP14C]|uniref:hypothetical protein n=1 Tax=Paraburkholderia sp. UYCP14C TaxID=2511130 RepID=UPI00101EA32A|nr:hypothetical protein [Paraburkholderia sp. UYCP14C]RZF30901.1 hypothetical protein EVC45_05410 [Paraburkholderia sp. UYCP14C]